MPEQSIPKSSSYSLSLKDLMSGKLIRISQKLQAVSSIVETVASGLSVLGDFEGLIKLGVDIDQTRVRYQTLLGSVGKGNQLFQKIEQLSIKSPYDTAELLKDGQNMLSLGMAQEKILPSMRMLGDIASGSQGKLHALTSAYAQIQSSGHLTTQTLKDMTDAGFNPLKVISKSTGRSMASLRKDMLHGSLSAGMITKALQLATSKGGRFHDMMNRLGNTVGGKMMQLKNRITILIAQIVTTLKPVISIFENIGLKAIGYLFPVIDMLTKLFKWVNQNKLSIGLLGIAVAALSGEFLIALVRMKAFAVWQKIVTFWTQTVTAVQWLWNAAMNANPIGIIIAAVAALAAIVIYLWNKFEWFRGGIVGMWEVLKNFGSIIKDFIIDRLKGILSGITGLGSALLHLFKGEWSEAWSAGKKAVGDLVGFGDVKKAYDKAKGIGKSFSEGYQKGVHMGKIGLPHTDLKPPKIPGYPPGAQAAAKLKTKVPDLSNLQTVPSAAGQNLSVTHKTKPAGIANWALSTGEDKAHNVGEKSAGYNVQGITGGGQRQTHITINLGKLQDKTEIHTTTLAEGLDQVEDRIKETLLSVLQHVNPTAIA